MGKLAAITAKATNYPGIHADGNTSQYMLPPGNGPENRKKAWLVVFSAFLSAVLTVVPVRSEAENCLVAEKIPLGSYDESDPDGSIIMVWGNQCSYSVGFIYSLSDKSLPCVDGSGGKKYPCVAAVGPEENWFSSRFYIHDHFGKVEWYECKETLPKETSYGKVSCGPMDDSAKESLK